MAHFPVDLSEQKTEIDRSDPLVGSTLHDRFRLDARIAAGGFGAIYRATHLPSKRKCAIKILHPDLAADLHVLARFRREGATLAQLKDPHTVTTYEFGQAGDGTLFIVMELLHGHSLLDRLRVEGPLPWREVVMMARQICDSLAEAHALGIVHRDLKPANIHLERDDFVKVLDFGVAKIRRGSDGGEDEELTGVGQMIGTSDYMAPEQMMGQPCDGRCDLYTLGVVMYEAITGWRPFAEAVNPASQLTLMLTQAVKPMSITCPVPPELDRVVMACLSRDIGDRYATAHQLGAALDKVLAGGDRHPDLEATTVVAHRRPRPPTPPPPPVTPPHLCQACSDKSGDRPARSNAAGGAEWIEKTPPTDLLVQAAARVEAAPMMRIEPVEPIEPVMAVLDPSAHTLPVIDDRPSWKAVGNHAFELHDATTRETTVRRAVWTLVVVIVTTLGIVAANVL